MLLSCLRVRVFKKRVLFLEGSWNHEYFGSLAKLTWSPKVWILRVSCKVSEPEGLHVNFTRDPKYSWFHEPSKNLIYCFYLHFIINNWYIENIYNLGDKTILYLIFNRINGFVGVQKRKSGTASVNTYSRWSKREACFARASQVWLAVNHNTSVTFDVQSDLQLGSCQSNFVWLIGLWTVAKF